MLFFLVRLQESSQAIGTPYLFYREQKYKKNRNDNFGSWSCYPSNQGLDTEVIPRWLYLL